MLFHIDGIYVWSTACGPKDSRHEVMTIYRRYDVELPEDWFAAEKSVKVSALTTLVKELPKEQQAKN